MPFQIFIIGNNNIVSNFFEMEFKIGNMIRTLDGDFEITEISEDIDRVTTKPCLVIAAKNDYGSTYRYFEREIICTYRKRRE